MDENRSEPVTIPVAPLNKDEAVAVMVHGTFAGNELDAGHRWWQAGSHVANYLREWLPGSVRVAREREVFHWSGENSERARNKAATKLLHHLREMESQGQDYHLVGHSHGGSVIWNALKLSVILKRPLKGLKSWTTVGTPFMHHRSRGALNLTNLMWLVVGLLLLFPAMTAPKQLIRTLYNVSINSHSAVVLKPDDQVFAYSRIVRTPVLAVIDTFGVPVLRKPDGIHVGSFDPDSGIPLWRYFFATPEGLFLMATMVLLSYFFIHFAVLCISPAIESYRIRLEQRLHRRAFDVYGERWLGIWSPDDEAINGLRATLNVSVSFVPKMAPGEFVFLSDIRSLLSRPYFWLIAPLYNRFVYPAIDEKIRSIVVRSAQGSDRPTATLVDVTPVPIPDAEHLAPALPALLNAKILSHANQNAREMVPKLRRMIAQTSFVAGMEAFGGQLSGNELVHTAYFNQDEVLKLIAANMAWVQQSPQDTKLGSMPPWLRKWFFGFKNGIRDADANGVSPASAPQTIDEPPQREAG